MLVRRRKRPSGCRRGSLRILKTGPSTSLRCITLLAHLVRAVHHRAQLEHLEAAPVHADALLGEERRSAGYRTDRERCDHDDRRGNDQQHAPEDDVDCALQRPPELGHLALRRSAHRDLHGAG